MPNSRKKILKQISTGLILTGLPSLASAKEKQTENKTNIDAADFTDIGASDDEKFSMPKRESYFK